MTRIEKVIKEIADLYNFYKNIQKIGEKQSKVDTAIHLRISSKTDSPDSN